MFGEENASTPMGTKSTQEDTEPLVEQPLETVKVRVLNVGFLNLYCGWSRAQGYILELVTNRLKKRGQVGL